MLYKGSVLSPSDLDLLGIAKNAIYRAKEKTFIFLHIKKWFQKSSLCETAPPPAFPPPSPIDYVENDK